MIKPIFEFESGNGYFHVNVKNLESLSVEVIQTIELFVKRRRGIFDFETYSFEIQKCLSFQDFKKILQESKLDVILKEKELQEHIQHARVGFGQYKGVFYHELPDSYLLWLYTNYKGYDSEKIIEEMKRRRL